MSGYFLEFAPWVIVRRKKGMRRTRGGMGSARESPAYGDGRMIVHTTRTKLAEA